MWKTNAQIKDEALAALKGKWNGAVVATLLLLVISTASSLIPWVGSLATYFVALPMAWMLYTALLELLRTGKAVEPISMFDIFQDADEYLRITLTMLLATLYTLLWSLLLIVPGVIKAYSYVMTIFILKDEPTLSYNAAIERSMAMMEGHKMRLFVLNLSMLGWVILGAITVVGLLWVVPYFYATMAAFYEELKQNTPQEAAELQIEQVECSGEAR